MKSTAELQDFAPFAGLSETGRSLLGRGLRYTHYSKKTTVLRKGQKISGAYFVVSGRLRVYTLSPDGNEATLYFINPGETCVLALNCIFNDLLYPAWVDALSQTRLAEISGTMYRALFETEPAIRSMTVQAFSTIVFRLMAELEDVHVHSLEKRLAGFLMLHASTDGSVHMTQQEIASHLGTTREVIARLLRQLAAAHLIDTQRRQVVVTSPARLAALMTSKESAAKRRKRPERKLQRR